MNKLLKVLLSAGLFIIFCSCTKETVKVETVTVRDTVYVHDTTVIPSLISDTTTTFIILRHAEKEPAGTDPNLNSDGIVRAEELKRILSNVPVNAIYSTPFKRTRQTVQPLADYMGLNITEYDANTALAQFTADILSAARGKVVVIAGHSNTVPEMLNELTDGSFNISISEGQYDNLFIVNLPDSLTPTVVHLKYGKPTP